MMAVDTEKMRDGNENHRAEGGGGKRIPETSAEDLQLNKNPPANERANDSKSDIRDASEAAPPRDFPREPASN